MIKFNKKKKTKYLLDQNCSAAIGEIIPANFVNVDDIMKAEGIEPVKRQSYHDSVILDVAIKHGYTIITKDKGLVIRTIIKGKDIIFSDFEGLHLIRGTKTKHIIAVGELV